eukprot:6041816-Pyramimonas_sp.AAC.4
MGGGRSKTRITQRSKRKEAPVARAAGLRGRMEDRPFQLLLLLLPPLPLLLPLPPPSSPHGEGGKWRRRTDGGRDRQHGEAEEAKGERREGRREGGRGSRSSEGKGGK